MADALAMMVEHDDAAPKAAVVSEEVAGGPPTPEAPPSSPDWFQSDEEEWTGELEPLTEVEQAQLDSRVLSAVEMDEGYFDQLWDWTRAEPAKMAKFLGGTPNNSRHMRELCGYFGPGFFAILETHIQTTAQVHIGCAGVQMANHNMAFLHLFLAPEARGRIRVVVPQLMDLAQRTYPMVETFVVASDNPEDMRLYRPLGFKVSYLLKWERPVTVTQE